MKKYKFRITLECEIEAQDYEDALMCLENVDLNELDTKEIVLKLK